ncbi:hypothetical protein F8M41_012072 [Gigaspora margarita]|uniref:Uncharacterized protein n=1 Tax=Gigaspora margarita TaxID=4874 RepID=A0A8H3WYM5_GIGMA|nr:hypothetical protein F8M41_012072 [Gigaspora margarita]
MDDNIFNKNGILNDDNIFDNNNTFNDNESIAQDLRTTVEMESNNQNSMFNSRDNNQNQDNIISSNRIVSSRLISIPDSRDNLTLYRSMIALKLRNKFDFLNRISRAVLDSRMNSQFDYVFLNHTLRSRPISPLRSRNNEINIMRNNTHDTIQSITLI